MHEVRETAKGISEQIDGVHSATSTFISNTSAYDIGRAGHL
jgi:hypothetical protein